tara:strand:- start:855 stop:2510 length:1656 start_codon:yes stop_codon:yes gene_type:complete
MQKVIGLDIGSYSIKAIEIINTFKTYEVTNFYEIVVPSIEGLPLDAVVPICMEQLFIENNLEADRIITAMPGQFISSRILPFQFSDPRKVESSVFVELEEQVPFNFDDMIMDHQIIGNHKGNTLALAVMTRKAFLRNFLELLSRINIDPKLVDVDSLAFYNLCSYMNIDHSKTIAMVDVGHEKTSVCIVQNGILRLFRSINLGGRYVTDFLARDLEINFQEAQRLKHRISRVCCANDFAEDLSEDDRIVADRTTLAVHAIIKELGRTFYAFKSKDEARISKIYLSGGASVLKNFDTFLGEQLETDVSRLDLIESGLKISNHLQPRIYEIPQSLAIGLRAVTTVKKHSQINLRQGEFSYVQDYESLLKGTSATFKIVALALLLLTVSYVFKLTFYTSQIDNLKVQYKKEFLRSFPDLKKSYKRKKMSFSKLRKDAESNLTAKIAEYEDAISEYKILNSSSAPLSLLQHISENIPKELLIDVVKFEFKSTFAGQGKMLLKAQTKDYESQAKIIDALKKVPVITSISEKSSGKTPGSVNRIEFTIEAKYDISSR